jgi:ribosome maturation factor RimP
VGETIRVRTVPGAAGDERRVAGILTAADDDGITVRTGTDDAGAPVERRLAYPEVERARTVFEWGPGDKPGKARRARTGRQATSNEKRDHRS